MLGGGGERDLICRWHVYLVRVGCMQPARAASEMGVCAHAKLVGSATVWAGGSIHTCMHTRTPTHTHTVCPCAGAGEGQEPGGTEAYAACCPEGICQSGFFPYRLACVLSLSSCLQVGGVFLFCSVSLKRATSPRHLIPVAVNTQNPPRTPRSPLPPHKDVLAIDGRASNALARDCPPTGGPGCYHRAPRPHAAFPSEPSGLRVC